MRTAAELFCWTFAVICIGKLPPGGASGVLNIRITGFANPRGHTYDGACCDKSDLDTRDFCQDQCDYVMRLIVSGLGRANDHVFLFHRPLKYDSNDISFEAGDSNMVLSVLFDRWPLDGQVKMNAFFYDYDDFDHTTTLVDWFETDLRYDPAVIGSDKVIKKGHFRPQTVTGNREKDKTLLTFEWAAVCHEAAECSLFYPTWPGVQTLSQHPRRVTSPHPLQRRQQSQVAQSEPVAFTESSMSDFKRPGNGTRIGARLARNEEIIGDYTRALRPPTDVIPDDSRKKSRQDSKIDERETKDLKNAYTTQHEKTSENDPFETQFNWIPAHTVFTTLQNTRFRNTWNAFDHFYRKPKHSEDRNDLTQVHGHKTLYPFEHKMFYSRKPFFNKHNSNLAPLKNTSDLNYKDRRSLSQTIDDDQTKQATTSLTETQNSDLHRKSENTRALSGNRSRLRQSTPVGSSSYENDSQNLKPLTQPSTHSARDSSRSTQSPQAGHSSQTEVTHVHNSSFDIVTKVSEGQSTPRNGLDMLRTMLVKTHKSLTDIGLRAQRTGQSPSAGLTTARSNPELTAKATATAQLSQLIQTKTPRNAEMVKDVFSLSNASPPLHTATTAAFLLPTSPQLRLPPNTCAPKKRRGKPKKIFLKGRKNSKHSTTGPLKLPRNDLSPPVIFFNHFSKPEKITVSSTSQKETAGEYLTNSIPQALLVSSLWKPMKSLKIRQYNIDVTFPPSTTVSIKEKAELLERNTTLSQPYKSLDASLLPSDADRMNLVQSSKLIKPTAKNERNSIQHLPRYNKEKEQTLEKDQKGVKPFLFKSTLHAKLRRLESKLSRILKLKLNKTPPSQQPILASPSLAHRQNKLKQLSPGISVNRARLREEKTETGAAVNPSEFTTENNNSFKTHSVKSVGLGMDDDADEASLLTLSVRNDSSANYFMISNNQNNQSDSPLLQEHKYEALKQLDSDSSTNTRRPSITGPSDVFSKKETIKRKLQGRNVFLDKLGETTRAAYGAVTDWLDDNSITSFALENMNSRDDPPDSAAPIKNKWIRATAFKNSYGTSPAVFADNKEKLEGNHQPVENVHGVVDEQIWTSMEHLSGGSSGRDGQSSVRQPSITVYRSGLSVNSSDSSLANIGGTPLISSVSKKSHYSNIPKISSDETTFSKSLKINKKHPVRFNKTSTSFNSVFKKLQSITKKLKDVIGSNTSSSLSSGVKNPAVMASAHVPTHTGHSLYFSESFVSDKLTSSHLSRDYRMSSAASELPMQKTKVIQSVHISKQPGPKVEIPQYSDQSVVTRYTNSSPFTVDKDLLSTVNMFKLLGNETPSNDIKVKIINSNKTKSTANRSSTTSTTTSEPIKAYNTSSTSSVTYSNAIFQSLQSEITNASVKKHMLKNTSSTEKYENVDNFETSVVYISESSFPKKSYKASKTKLSLNGTPITFLNKSLVHFESSTRSSKIKHFLLNQSSLLNSIQFNIQKDGNITENISTDEHFRTILADLILRRSSSGDKNTTRTALLAEDSLIEQNGTRDMQKKTRTYSKSNGVNLVPTAEKKSEHDPQTPDYSGLKPDEPNSRQTQSNTMLHLWSTNSATEVLTKRTLDSDALPKTFALHEGTSNFPVMLLPSYTTIPPVGLPEDGFVLHTHSATSQKQEGGILSTKIVQSAPSVPQDYGGDFVYGESKNSHLPSLHIPHTALYNPGLARPETNSDTDTPPISASEKMSTSASVPEPVERHQSLTPTLTDVALVLSRHWPAVLGVAVGTIFLLTALVTSVLCRQRRLLVQRSRWVDSPQHLNQPPAPASEYGTCSAASISSDLTRSSTNLVG